MECSVPALAASFNWALIIVSQPIMAYHRNLTGEIIDLPGFTPGMPRWVFNVFRGSTIQMGQGIGSFLGGLARSAMPLVKSFAGKALKTGLLFAKDAMAGGDLKMCPKTCQDCWVGAA